MNGKNNLALFVIVAVACTLWLPNLFTKGMFLDGVYNALYAHKLAKGISTFWEPQTVYYRNPVAWGSAPLSALFLAGFYKVFGDHYFVDKIYSLTCALFQLLLIRWLWRVYFFEKEKEKGFWWLPCILWLISPFTSWCYSSNLMENTMCIFTTLALVSFLLFRKSENRWLVFSLIGGGSIFLAILAKGPVGLYPLAMPVFFLVGKNIPAARKTILYATVQILFLVILFAMVFSSGAPARFLHNYIAEQLGPSIKQGRIISLASFEVLVQILVMLWPILLVTALPFFISFKKQRKSSELLWDAFRFIGIGLSASLPIILSGKQRSFYLLPSLPAFVIGLSMLILPMLSFVRDMLTEGLKKKMILTAKVVCSIIIAGSLFLSFKNKGTILRDELLLKDLDGIQRVAGSKTKVIMADWEVYNEWALRGYLDRYYDKKICMPDDTAFIEFYLTKHGRIEGHVPSNARHVFSGGMMDLYFLPKP